MTPWPNITNIYIYIIIYIYNLPYQNGNSNFSLEVEISISEASVLFRSCFLDRRVSTVSKNPSSEESKLHGRIGITRILVLDVWKFLGGTGGKACQHGKFLGPTSCINEFSTPFTVCKKSKLLHLLQIGR